MNNYLLLFIVDVLPAIGGNTIKHKGTSVYYKPFFVLNNLTGIFHPAVHINACKKSQTYTEGGSHT